MKPYLGWFWCWIRGHKKRKQVSPGAFRCSRCGHVEHRKVRQQVAV